MQLIPNENDRSVQCSQIKDRPVTLQMTSGLLFDVEEQYTIY